MAKGSDPRAVPLYVLAATALVVACLLLSGYVATNVARLLTSGN